MNHKIVARLLVVAGLIGLLTGCDEGVLNHNPIINSLTATPDTTVRPGETVALAVSATDEDNDSLAFVWSVTAGALSANIGQNVVWTAPLGSTSGTVSVACSDGQGGTDTAYKAVNARAWEHFDLDGFTPDSSGLLNPGTTEMVFLFEFKTDGPFPANALVDSIFVTTDFMPQDSLEREWFNVWVVSPSGTLVLIYDGFNLTHLNVDDLILPEFVNEPADGVWKLRVTRQNAGTEGYAEECGLTIHYRF
jgi:hypothetical protein